MEADTGLMKIQARRVSEGVGIIPRLRVGLVEKPLVNWNTRFSSGQFGAGPEDH